MLLDLEGEPGAVLRLVRALLKRLGRDHGVRCTSVRELGATASPPGGGA